MQSRVVIVGLVLLPIAGLPWCAGVAPGSDASNPTPAALTPPVAEARPYTVVSPNGAR